LVQSLHLPRRRSSIRLRECAARAWRRACARMEQVDEGRSQGRRVPQ
jgi:hypothetical protein